MAVKTSVPSRVAGCWMVIVALLGAAGAVAQARLDLAGGEFTVEAYGNASAGTDFANRGRDGVQLDGGLRTLGLWQLRPGVRVGARVVAEGLAGLDDDLAIAERSILVTGTFGRFELGRRQGLPDVLTGYAPNNFTFTGAEFGPASGLGLDPAGGLVSRYQPPAVAAALDELSVPGYATGLFYDRSPKLIWVSPKANGFLAGLSYSPDAGRSGAAQDNLLQAGLTREVYWAQNVLRLGGSWSRLRTGGGDELHSFQAGAALTWRDDWMLGLAATSSPDRARVPVSDWAEAGRGISVSLNYNHGPWTLGGFGQAGRSRPPGTTRDERLAAAAAGASWRASTRARIYIGYYRFSLSGVTLDAGADARGGSLIGGLRVTL